MFTSAPSTQSCAYRLGIMLSVGGLRRVKDRRTIGIMAVIIERLQDTLVSFTDFGQQLFSQTCIVIMHFLPQTCIFLTYFLPQT